MVNYDIIMEGCHNITGYCGFTEHDKENDRFIIGVIIQIDGRNYKCYEHICGWYSYGVLEVTYLDCTYTFPPIRVNVSRLNSDNQKGLQIVNYDNSKTILKIGTYDYKSDRCCAIYDWHPENLDNRDDKNSHNTAKDSNDWCMKSDEICDKIRSLLSTEVYDNVIGVIDEYYKEAYKKGWNDAIESVGNAIGHLVRIDQE